MRFASGMPGMGKDRRIRIKAATLLAAGLSLAALVGCASEPRPTWQPQPDPLALRPAPEQPTANERPGTARQPGRLPWYAIRNEVEPTVNAGIRLPVIEESYTTTVDRQRVINGRVYDHYRSTTYRDQLRRTIR